MDWIFTQLSWVFTSLNWYVWVFVIGLVFFPLTKKIFGRFSFDLGYPFAKVLAILFVTYATYVLGTIKLLSFSRMNLFLIIGIFALINWLLFERAKRVEKSKKMFSTSSNSKFLIIIFEEMLFLTAFLFLDLHPFSGTVNQIFGKIYGLWLYEFHFKIELFSP